MAILRQFYVKNAFMRSVIFYYGNMELLPPLFNHVKKTAELVSMEIEITSLHVANR